MFSLLTAQHSLWSLLPGQVVAVSRFIWLVLWPQSTSKWGYFYFSCLGFLLKVSIRQYVRCSTVETELVKAGIVRLSLYSIVDALPSYLGCSSWVITLFFADSTFFLVSLISIISSYLALCFLFFTQNIDFIVVGIAFLDAPALHRSTYVRSGALTKRKSAWKSTLFR